MGLLERFAKLKFVFLIRETNGDIVSLAYFAISVKMYFQDPS